MDELNKLIASSGITKKKLAELAGVAQITVMRWCNGTSPVPPLVIEKLRRIDAVVNEKTIP